MEFINTPSPLRATFFKHANGHRDMVEIRVVGDPNSIIQKVTPEHIDQFPREWDAYQKRQEKTPEPEANGVKGLAKDQFRPGIRRTDTRHHL